VTGAEEDRGRFKTPTLRGAALRGPFMHDGSLATLRDVVEFYVRGGTENPHLDSAMASLELSNAETEHLLAFLEALSRTLD
jgi:cytochrome c peroxidase